jgi:3-phenylpropionate/cinnamic acid dioxygenase small subunit
MTISDRLELRLECEEFLFREAELLDDRKLHEWFELVTDDIEYRVPRRVTRERGASQSEFSDDAFLYYEDAGTLKTRVKRYDSEYAWAENPPSRTRRLVSNVRVRGEANDEIDVRNNLLLYRSQGDTTEYDLIVGERKDVLRRVDGSLKLAERVVHLDQTILGTRNLSFFL